jgi:hypothetical protein
MYFGAYAKKSSVSYEYIWAGIMQRFPGIFISLPFPEKEY